MTSLRREDLIRALPYARRYARALTGSQPRGDTLVAESLRELLDGDEPGDNAQFGLYRSVTQTFREICRRSEPVRHRSSFRLAAATPVADLA